MPKSRTILPVVVEAEAPSAVTTAHAGVLAYLELWCAIGLPDACDRRLRLHGRQGWLTRQLVQAVLLINLLGGDCVTDVDRLEQDAGLCALARLAEAFGLNREEKRGLERRFRAGRTRTFPAATQLYAFLEQFHHAEEERRRPKDGVAFIPTPLAALRDLQGLNALLLAFLQRHAPQDTATLDVDATLVPTAITTAKFCYKHYRAYQPLNVFWAEQQVVVHSEFRDGNVPAGYQVRRVVEEALAHLPPGVRQVRLRSDSAGYDTDLFFWCERAREHPDVGRIRFTISAAMTQELRGAILQVTDWTPEYRTTRTGERSATGREYAEVVYVPNTHAVQTDIREPFRYIAIRERLKDQMRLNLDDGAQLGLPFPTAVMGGMAYKLAAIVTNRREDDAAEVIRWHYGRCGKSEEAHAIMKEDFAGGQMPSRLFGANAAWWALMLLTLNLVMLGKRVALGEAWFTKRMKALRFGLLTQAGRLTQHARQTVLRVRAEAATVLTAMRTALARLVPVPT